VATAYGAYVAVDDAELTASDLESYGEAAWWSGKLDEAIAHRERAYAAYTADGDTLGAARMALTVAGTTKAVGRSPSPAAGSRLPSDCSRTARSSRARPAAARARLDRLFAEGDLERASASSTA
jgi:hypothetical protein